MCEVFYFIRKNEDKKLGKLERKSVLAGKSLYFLWDTLPSPRGHVVQQLELMNIEWGQERGEGGLLDITEHYKR